MIWINLFIENKKSVMRTIILVLLLGNTRQIITKVQKLIQWNCERMLMLFFLTEKDVDVMTK